MKLGTRFLLLAVPMSLAGCDGLYPFPGKVTKGEGTLSGTFTLSPWPTASGAIPSDGTGGACLLVAMNDIPGYESMKCTAENLACGPFPAGELWKRWFTYCDLPKNAPAGAEGKCWGKRINIPALRPQLEAQACNRSGDYDPPVKWQADVEHPVNRAPLQLQSPIYDHMAKPSHWRILACVKEKPGPEGQEVCRWGDVEEVP